MARTKYADKLAEFERRITKLEQDVEALKLQFAEREKNERWWNNLTPMTEAEEKIQDEIDAAGRAYRESLCPKASTPAKKKKATTLSKKAQKPGAKLVTKR